MKFIKEENGFTLVELLVVINLSFLVLSFVVSFYLLMNKYFVGTTKKFEEKHTTYDFLYKLEELTNKTEHYSMEIQENVVRFIINQDTVVFSNDKMTSNRFMSFDKISNYELKISTLLGKEIIMNEGKLLEPILSGEKKVIVSDSINSIALSFEKGQKYQCQIYNNPVPYSRFRNL